MDPEAMEEFKEQHAKVSGFQSAMASGDLKSGYVHPNTGLPVFNTIIMPDYPPFLVVMNPPAPQ